MYVGGERKLAADRGLLPTSGLTITRPCYRCADEVIVLGLIDLVLIVSV